jgi:hypothetical protein
VTTLEFVYAVLVLLVFAGLGVLVIIKLGPYIESLKLKILGGNEFSMSTRATEDLAEFGAQLVIAVNAIRTTEASRSVSAGAPTAGLVVEAPAGTVELNDAVGITDELQVERWVDPVAETQDEDARRAQLELVINAAAEWGWMQAKAGTYSSVPHPVVSWDKDGRPAIEASTTDVAAAAWVRQRARSVFGAHLELSANQQPSTSRGGATARLELHGDQSEH